MITWYIKYYTNNLTTALADIQTAPNKRFSRSKSEVQSVIGFKEIIMRHVETPWELDKRLKFQICKANMNLTD